MYRYDRRRQATFSQCRSCGRQIIWVKTQAGKNMPCDSTLVDYIEVVGGRERIVTTDGKVVAGRTDIQSGAGDGVGYISHFASCPNAAQHRRR